jgi:hypothetical protein
MKIKLDWRGEKASSSNEAIGEPWEEYAMAADEMIE